MSRIALQTPETGTGTFTFAAPVGNTNRTLSIPDASGTLQTELTNGFGFRNRIINGDMDTAQRATSATITAGSTIAAGYATVDRFYTYCSGANVTAARVAGSGASLYRFQITGAASVTGVGVGQRIEQLNSFDLAGNTCTLSVDLANSLLTTVTWTAFYANTADTFGTLASPTRTQIASGTFTVNSSITRYTTNITVPSAATTGIEIVFTVGAQTSGTWTIGNVQLEAGAVATPFERRPYGQELALCQRYLPAFNSTGTISTVGFSVCPGATNVRGFYTFKTTPRVAPTGITVSSASHFTPALGVTGFSTSAMTFGFASLEACAIECAVSGATAGQAGQLFANSTSGQILFTGCEL